MYTLHVDPVSILLLLSLDFNFFNAKRLLPDLTIWLGQAAGGEEIAMSLPRLATKDFAPCIPDRKAPTSASPSAVLVYGSDILTRIFESPFRNSSFTERP